MSEKGSESSSDAAVAAALYRELSRAGGARRFTVRSLRDRFHRGRLTAAARDEISEALARARIGVEPQLDRAALDDEVLLRRARRRRRLGEVGSRVWKGAVAGVGLLATLVGLYAFFREELTQPPVRRLGGDLNVGVAPFTAVATAADEGPGPQGKQLAGQVRRTLVADLDRRARHTDVSFEVAPPPGLQPITGASEGARAAMATRAAQRINADMLIYGSVRVIDGTTVIAPRFFIAGRALGNAEELVGVHRLGAELRISGSVSESVAARIDARRLLSARTSALSDFVIGLSYFGQRDYVAASRWFGRAERGMAAAHSGGLEVIYLFLGHAAGRTGALERAKAFYARALSIDPGYARALLGMAEVRFQQAHRGCRPGLADERGLRIALNGFRAVERQRQPDGSLLAVRARFSRARVLMCLSQAGIQARWAEAASLLRDVVARYERGQSLLRDEASEALADLGLIELPSRREASPQGKLRKAGSLYRRALGLSRDPHRQAVFWGMLGFIRGRLGEVPAAKEAYQRALQLDPRSRSSRRYEQALRAPNP
jgi:tetratricopeptide (TPR) repeat protein